MKTRFPNRRAMIAGMLSAGAVVAFSGTSHGRQVAEPGPNMQPGDYTWHPERSREGTVAVIVSLPEQRVYVYRDGVRIAVSTCSSGKPGHSTPTGVFVVLQKDKHHHSSTYNNAPMPNMNRLTWSGVALHAGNLPGYPASHGCVRLPLEFSELLFGITHVGTPVIIADAHSQPAEVVHPGMVLAAYAEHEFDDVTHNLNGKKHPVHRQAEEKHAVTTVIASSADRVIELIDHDRVVAKSKLTIVGDRRLGSHVYTLVGGHGGAKGMHWSVISHSTGSSSNAAELAAINHVQAEHEFVEAMKQHMHPGMLLVLTDQPLDAAARSSGFTIATG